MSKEKISRFDRRIREESTRAGPGVIAGLITAKKVLEIVEEEVRKNFPPYPEPLPEKEYTKKKWYAMLDEWDSEVQKWYVEWFVDEGKSKD